MRIHLSPTSKLGYLSFNIFVLLDGIMSQLTSMSVCRLSHLDAPLIFCEKDHYAKMAAVNISISCSIRAFPPLVRAMWLVRRMNLSDGDSGEGYSAKIQVTFAFLE